MTKIKGCSVIYQPSGRAGEYADLAVNLFHGCDHGCQYCFVPAIPWFDEAEFRSGVKIRKHILSKLEHDAKILQGRDEKRRILMCFTCDPYPNDEDARKITSQAIRILKSYDLNIQILTKGGTRALVDLNWFTPSDAFASTLTLTDSARLKEWESGAATFEERIFAIRKFHEAGIPTWASLEPVIEPREALRIIERTHSYVDLFKAGKLNYANRLPPHLRQRVEGIDWQKFAVDVVELLETLGKPYLIKDDLKAYLPGETK